MALHETAIIDDALQHYAPTLAEQTRFLRKLIWERYPEANELIYIKDKYFAVGWGFGDKQTDLFVTFAVYTQHINLGFSFGGQVPDPHGYLQGSGNMYRYYRMRTIEDFPTAEMLRFMDEGWTIAHAKFKQPRQPIMGQTILKQDTRKS